MSTPYQQQPYHPQQPPQAPSPQAQAPWAAQSAQPQQAQQPQAQWAQQAQAQATGHPQQYAQSAQVQPAQAQLAQQQAYQAQQQALAQQQAQQQALAQQQAYQAQLAQQAAPAQQQAPWAQGATPPAQAQWGYAPSAPAGPQGTGNGFQQATSGYAAALTGGQGAAGWMNGLVAGGLAAEEPPAENLKKATMFALLSVPLGMVLAAVVSYVSWEMAVPRAIVAAPGAAAGFAAVWLFLRKVDQISQKGLIRLVVVGVMAAVGLLAAAAGADMFYITSQGLGEYASEMIQSSAKWYVLFVVGNFGGLFGALRTLR